MPTAYILASKQLQSGGHPMRVESPIGSSRSGNQPYNAHLKHSSKVSGFRSSQESVHAAKRNRKNMRFNHQQQVGRPRSKPVASIFCRMSSGVSGVETTSSGAQLEVVGSCKLTYLGMPVDPETVGSRDLKEVEM